MMTHQQVYDEVAQHLIKQRSKAVGEDAQGSEVCVYRSEDEKQCAVGCLILDEDYVESMEGDGPPTLFSNYPKEMERAGLVWSHHGLLDDLQRLHDNEEVEDWPVKLEELAGNHGLIDVYASSVDPKEWAADVG